MRYEDMLGKSGAQLRGTGVPAAQAERRAVKRAIAKSSFAELRAQEEQHGFKERPANATQFFREGRAGQWREALSKEQIGRICVAHAPTMQPPIPPCGSAIWSRTPKRRVGRAGADGAVGAGEVRG